MNSFLKVCGITFQFNASAALIVSGILAISRTVRSLTQRLKGYTIEYQHRYRRSRKSSTGCGGLRALYMLMMFVAMQRHGHAEAVHPVCGGSSPPISVDVVTIQYKELKSPFLAFFYKTHSHVLLLSG